MVSESTNFPKPLITSMLFFANIKNEEGYINLPHLRAYLISYVINLNID